MGGTFPEPGEVSGLVRFSSVPHGSKNPRVLLVPWVIDSALYCQQAVEIDPVRGRTTVMALDSAWPHLGKAESNRLAQDIDAVRGHAEL